ncbi:hypothetical protein [Shimia biformata]|uniref:hypothetical protein n=1 Tax=Shimia biformata TaxID=1294299 RepID=UPI00195165BD|nr:hypothetical protein [Shimia biformata]
MIENLIVLTVAALCFAGLFLAPFARSPLWRATVTPLASIIGSGFLVSAPLLAREFGGYAAPAMASLIALAWLIGGAIRYNIAHVEQMLATDGQRAVHSLERLSHYVLAFAYFVSVAYYLSLLGNFLLQSIGAPNEALARWIAIALVLFVGGLGWSGGVSKVAKIERYATSLNLSVIAAFLVGLVVFAVTTATSGQSIAPPPGRFDLASIPVLLGLLIVVQGFETTRFTGDEFDRATRQRAMKLAQIIAAVIYVAFFLLLSPLLTTLADGSGVAAIITVSGAVALVLPLVLTLAAVASQFSAAVADSIGNEGLIHEISHGRVDPRHGYLLIAVVGIAILISTDVTEVIALASRAFALFYALQCGVAFLAARSRPGDGGKNIGFAMLAVLSTLVFVLGVPAE